MNKKVIPAVVAALSCAALFAAPASAEKKHESNTLKKAGNAIAYSVHKDAKAVGYSAKKDAKAVDYSAHKSANNVAVTTHRAIGQNSVVKEHGRKVIEKPNGKRVALHSSAASHKRMAAHRSSRRHRATHHKM